MKSKWKHFKTIGDGQVIGIAFLTDEKRIELFSNRINAVSSVIDIYSMMHLSSKSRLEITEAIKILYEQDVVLRNMTDEEQLVDSSEQDDLRLIYTRLFTVVTIYEDYLVTLDSGKVNDDKMLVERDFNQALGSENLAGNLAGNSSSRSSAL